MPQETFNGFPKEAVQFLKDLARHNNTAWFHANKTRYEDAIKKPASAFLAGLLKSLNSILPDISMGKVMRINRDIRFSKDKSPYKTHVAMILWNPEGGKSGDMSSSSLYFHLEADKLILGDGIYQLEDKSLPALRRALVHPIRGKQFAEIVKKLKGYEIGGKFYKKVPSGFNPQHPNAEYLKYKGMYVSVEIPLPKETFSQQLVPFCLAHFKKLLPFHRWLEETI